jgi:hypothetical protein
MDEVFKRVNIEKKAISEGRFAITIRTSDVTKPNKDGELRTTKDCKTILILQPSDDLDDLLN